jgi:hypothetical protein
MDGLDIRDEMVEQARTNPIAVANDLAVLVAHEHRRAADEQRRRKDAESTAADLAVLLAHEHAALQRERTAREEAEDEARELAALLTQRSHEQRRPARRFGRSALARA